MDTATDEWSHWVTDTDGSTDWVWREKAIGQVLATHRHRSLFVAGCTSNQGIFYPADVLLARVAARNNNLYGTSRGERDLMLRRLAARRITEAELDEVLDVLPMTRP